MILDHVSQHTGVVVVTATTFNSQIFENADLDVIDVVPVPKRLEYGVGESENQDILDGVFAEIVIDSEYLIFVQDRVRQIVQCTRRFVIGAERFFYDDPA